jgi:hypothetical protein
MGIAEMDSLVDFRWGLIREESGLPFEKNG